MKLFNRIISVICIVIIALSSIEISVFGSDGAVDIVEKFDSKMGMYTQTFANGRQFVTSIPNGESTYDAVIINMPRDISAELKCDGYVVSLKSGEPLYEKGLYVLKVSAGDTLTDENVAGIFTFRIMGTPAGGEYSKDYGCRKIVCSNSFTSAENGFLLYKFPNHKGFYSSVENGSTDNKSAGFIFPVNIGYKLKRNGKQITYRDNETITAPGNYTLVTYAKNYGSSSVYEAVYENVLTFSIPDTTAAEKAANAVVSSINAVSSAISNSEDTDKESEASENENIISDDLTETYNESANMYKEAFSNGDGFYTNIANNDLSGGNVYIDIPSNMSVSMTKDGLPQDFQNKTYMNEQGTYVLNITLSSGAEKYKARFSFRIQNGIEASNSVNSSKEAEIEEVDDGDKDFSYTENADLSEFSNVYDSVRRMFVYTIGQESFYANMPNGMFANGSLELDIPGSLTCTVIKDGEDYEYSDELSETGEYEIYVSDMDGQTLTLNFSLYDRPVNTMEEYAAPSGYRITNIVYDDYNNTYKLNMEEETEEETDNSSEENLEDEEAEEAAAEVEKLRSTGAEGIDFINSINEKAVSEGLLSMPLPIDGSYTIELRGEDLPTISTEIKIDKTAPIVEFDGLDKNMKSVGNEVTVSCNDSQVTMTLFSKSGEETLLTESGGTATIKGPDTYTLVAVDLAGNKSEYEFKIVRHIGAAGVGAIVFLLLIIGGIAAFVIYSSKKFTVR